MKPKIKHIITSQVEAGVTPTPSNTNLALAFKQYNKIQAGYQISLNGKTKVRTRIEKRERSNWVLQKVLGPQLVPVTESVLVDETSYLTAELVSLIENVKNSVQQNKIEEQNREMQNQY